MEIVISLIALAFIFLAARLGWREGLFRALARFLFAALAVLVTLRYWHLYTTWLAGWLGFPADQLAFFGFWSLFAVIFVPLNALLGSLNDEFIPVYPRGLEQMGGAVCTALITLLLLSCLLLSLLPAIPEYAPGFNPDRMLLPLDRIPTAIYIGIDSTVTGHPPGSPSSPLLPAVGQGPDHDLQVVWR